MSRHARDETDWSYYTYDVLLAVSVAFDTFSDQLAQAGYLDAAKLATEQAQKRYDMAQKLKDDVGQKDQREFVGSSTPTVYLQKSSEPETRVPGGSETEA